MSRSTWRTLCQAFPSSLNNRGSGGGASVCAENEQFVFCAATLRTAPSATPTFCATVRLLSPAAFSRTIAALRAASAASRAFLVSACAHRSVQCSRRAFNVDGLDEAVPYSDVVGPLHVHRSRALAVARIGAQGIAQSIIVGAVENDTGDGGEIQRLMRVPAVIAGGGPQTDPLRPTCQQIADGRGVPHTTTRGADSAIVQCHREATEPRDARSLDLAHDRQHICREGVSRLPVGRGALGAGFGPGTY